MNPTFVDWFWAFVFTQSVETPLYRTLAPTTTARAFLASAITHPIVWLVFFSPRMPLVYEAKLALAETFAVVVEALWLMRCDVPRARAFGVAFLANLSSVVLGALSRWFFDWP